MVMHRGNWQSNAVHVLWVKGLLPSTPYSNTGFVPPIVWSATQTYVLNVTSYSNNAQGVKKYAIFDKP